MTQSIEPGLFRILCPFSAPVYDHPHGMVTKTLRFTNEEVVLVLEIRSDFWFSGRRVGRVINQYGQVFWMGINMDWLERVEE